MVVLCVTLSDQAFAKPCSSSMIAFAVPIQKKEMIDLHRPQNQILCLYGTGFGLRPSAPSAGLAHPHLVPPRPLVQAASWRVQLEAQLTVQHWAAHASQQA